MELTGHRMGRRGYPPAFRRKVLDLLAAGRRIADVARDLGISDQTICAWRAQNRIDRSEAPGLSNRREAGVGGRQAADQ